jgi:hypothetical protein
MQPLPCRIALQVSENDHWMFLNAGWVPPRRPGPMPPLITFLKRVNVMTSMLIQK